MFKQLLSLFITTVIYANSSTPPQTVPLNEPFEIESNSSNFNTDILYTHKELLKCNPKLEAVYKIEGTHKIKIIPKKQLNSGTTYRCEYHGNSISFITEPFEIKDYHYFKRDKLLRIEFNDQINIDTIKEYIHIRKKDKLATTELKYSIIQNNDRVVLLKIDEPVYNNTIELYIDKELKNIHDGTLGESFSATFNNKKMATVNLDDKKEPMIIDNAPKMIALDDGGFAIRLFFDDTLEGNPEDFIYIDEIENFTLDRDNYMSSSMRKKMGVSSDTYYYCDILSPDFKPNSTYHLTLKKGLQNYRELKEDKHYTLKSGDRAKSIIFDGDKPYISSKGELGFSSINIDSATIVVQRILDDNLRYFVNFANSNTEEVDNYLEELFSTTVKLNNRKNEIIKQKFSLRELNDGDLPFGVYKITIRYNDNQEEKSASRILFLSNIGISANISKTEAFIHVMNLDSAEPLFATMVYLYGANNELLGSAKSDKYGIVRIKDKDLLSKKPKGIIVQRKRDTNFLSLTTPIESPTVEDILKNHERFSAYIYAQSKIVRPEAKINALIIVKDRDYKSANNLPIKVVFQEKYGNALMEKVYHTDEYGLIDFNYQLDKMDKTGNYEIVAYIDDNIIGSTPIKVKAFMPPKIENHIKLSKDIYYIGEPIEANISSNYLFGAPASYLNGKIKVDSKPIDFMDKRYKNYTFANHEIESSNTQTYLHIEEDIKLDKRGELNVAIPTTIKQRVPSILEAMLEVTVMDDTQPVTSYKKLKLYPYKNMVGLKLDSTHFEKGQNLTGKAILIDSMSGKLIDRELYGVIKKVEWHYSYSDGNSNWEQESEIVDSFRVKSNEKFSRKIAQNGNYIIEIYDRLGGHSASSSFDVWWQDYTNISPKDDIKSIEIYFDEKPYKKDDTIKARIKSPILKGNLLLTVEDDKIEWFKVLEIEKGVTNIEVPIEFDNKNGAYLHATIYRATDRSSELIPFRAIGYKYIQPDKSSHKIDVKIESPNETKSKRALGIKIKTDKKSKILVSVVDRAILQLIDQQAPKIFEFFDKQSDKQISYYDFYDKLMSYLATGEMISFGAGDMPLDKRVKHLAPDLAKRIKPFMKWSKIITPSSNDISISLDIPEFNGKASIVVVAINSDSVGVASKDITIKDDVIIKPSYPRYVLKGDHIDVPIRIFNTTKEPKSINLTKKVSPNLSFEFDTKPIEIAPKSSIVIKAKLHAKEDGKGEISLQAHYGADIVSRSVELPIYTPYTISTKTFKGITNKEVKLTVPPEYKGATAYISLSDNLIGVLRDDLKYLVEYPYGCAEQTTSKILAMHYAKAFLKDDNLVKESKNFVRQGVKKLRNLQNYYGEFSYWEEDGDINPYASLYASQTLLELQKDGVYVDQSVIEKIISMLKSVTTADGDYLGSYSQFHQLYAAYILAQNGKLTPSSANMLYEKGFYKKHFLSSYYMAAILKMQGKTKEADELYASVPYSLESYLQKKYSSYSGNFESNIRDMFLHFIIKTKYFNRDNKDLAILQKSFNDIHSSQEKAIALKALSIYLGKPKNSDINVSFEINGDITNHNRPYYTTVDNISDSTIFITPKSGAVSYNIELVKPIPKALKNSLSTTKKLSIKREFIDESSHKVNLNHLKQGDTIYSKVTIANYGKINNVVVNQRVPACLSILNSNTISKKFENININEEYQDIRDDRVLDFINLAKKEKYDKYSKKYVMQQNRGVIFTPLLVTTEGICKVPAVIAEAMYDSSINDYAKDTKEIRVIDKNNSSTKTNSKTSLEDRAKALVKKLYYREMQSSNPDDFVELFHYPLKKYYHKKNATQQDIIKDKADYFKKWSSRVYKNIKLDTVDIDKAHKKVLVKITFDYTLKNDKKELKGTSKHLVTMQEFDKKLLITEITVAK
ncbi:MAG: hypothetical protein GXO60_07905 [Epsilonproteobacteria bacterium]|nr:hypothetical protein [Campylobacterota bacterium]